MKSTNSLIITGRLTADAKPMANNAGVRFSIAHNMGKNNPVLYIDFTMFSKNGKVEKAIPTDLLKKGKAVTVSAYMSPTEYKDADGNTVRGSRYIVKTVEPLVNEQVADEADPNEEEQAE